MLNIKTLRTIEPKIITIGSYPSIIQSILDFDYLSGKKSPSIVGIIAVGRKYERYFFGKREMMFPVYNSFDSIPESTKESINLFLNVSSGRRALTSSLDAFEKLPNLLGGSVFAEDVPEKHALQLYQEVKKQNKFIIGPASVGLLVPKLLKLGAIGGVDNRQFLDSHLFTPGNIAVFSASGGMTNEIIRVVAQNGKRISFSLSFGGDRFPVFAPREAFLAAENDPNTSTIVYFGELGGLDEYELAQLLKTKQVKKRVIAYIAGSISELFETPPQFGHAKAMAATDLETAKRKQLALQIAGAQVASSFLQFVELIRGIKTPDIEEKIEYNTRMDQLRDRRHGLIATSISKDEDGVVKILGEDLLSFSKQHSFGYIVASLFLGEKIKSKELEEFVDFVLRLLVEHGPYVSGAVNTIITSRAGRDLVSSLSSGLLTVGPRFGGAINQAASNWLTGVIEQKKPFDFVEEFASKKIYIAGIGHKKYRVDLPDPRVSELMKYTAKLKDKRFSKFAKEVEKITVAKKGNLILNVDGTIAAVLLDILFEKEGLNDSELKELVETEFFNAIFVLSRSVGFIAHFLDQKRLDEGLFRLEEDMVTEAQVDR